MNSPTMTKGTGRLVGRSGWLGVGVGVLLFGAATVRADVILDLSPTGNPGNVLFQHTLGTTVTGVTQSGFLVDVISQDSPPTILDSGGGQGQITSDGGEPFASFTIQANPKTPFTFQILQLNLDVGDGTLLDIVVEWLEGPVPKVTEILGISLSCSGNNRLALLTEQSAEAITSIRFTTSDPVIERVRQVRITGAAASGGGSDGGPPIRPNLDGTVVPEPNSLLIWSLVGVVVMAGAYEKRRRGRKRSERTERSGHRQCELI